MCIKEPTVNNQPIYKVLDLEKELLKVLSEDRVRFHIEQLKYIMTEYYHVELISSEVAGEIPFFSPDNEDVAYKYRLKFKTNEVFCGNPVTRFIYYFYNF